ncbi:FYVE zinc finger-domain-containing protein [Glomus cerebriforme]|uniref:FYVE zinc finger-domain-containing protein n=1 Tax=Glomus cerebriforme TaxID=658196 RepID=A0A397SYW6_9GLOM|nr:FYVE zinc finger-domain-containing protein [Glomus cerebriforme]
MSSFSDSNSLSNLSTSLNTLPASNSHRESLIFDDSSGLEQLACPICNECMISLLQLNRHLDDEHMDTSIDQKVGILKWFKNAQNTIMKPLSKTKLNNISQLAINKFSEFDINGLDKQSELVTKTHWQPDGEHIICSDFTCDKSLNILNGKHNCRKCGKFFCDDHCRLSMKLNKQAQHDPVNGYECRVCNDCFVSREGYLDTEGVVRSYTSTFIKIRTKGIERAHLEGNRLEQRLEKLAKVYATQIKQVNSTQGGLAPPLTAKHRRRASEQSIVKWQDDASVTSCPLCRTSFGKITNRKHHCRLCGRVICEKCSSKISLNLNKDTEIADQDSIGEIRACKECRSAVFRRKEYNEEIAKTPPVVMLYQKLTKIRSAIDSTLPKFQDMLIMLKSKEIINQTHADYQVAARTRKELLDSFTQFDAISKKINSLPTYSESGKRLQSNIHLAANQYLQQNMLPLSVLPKMFKKDQTKDQQNGYFDDDDDSPDAMFAAFANGRPRSLSMSSTKSVKEEEQLRQQLEAFLEQKIRLEEFIQEATRKRKFDDLKTLKTSLDEIKLEIDKKRKELGDLWP